MFITQLVHAAKRLVRRDAPSAMPGLLSTEQFALALARQRARSDRTDEVFSLIVFSLDRKDRRGEALPHLARILGQRLRITDDAGLIGTRQIGVILPTAAASGAWTVVDDVCMGVPAGIPMPECKVYCYPTDWPIASHDEEDELAERADGDEPARAMEPLFVRPMPLWKRAIDLVGALLVLIILAPFMAVVAVAVKLTSPGPVLFKQMRSGLGGKQFVMFKFRSMIAGAESLKSELTALNEQDGPAFKIKNDPRTTRLGRFLRRTSIDELPQLWNVLRGDMSLVGPRPLPCDESEACRGWLRRRLEATPGITCIWQVRGRSAVSFADWARMDVQYVGSRSFSADMKLLLQTLPAVISRRGAS